MNIQRTFPLFQQISSQLGATGGAGGAGGAGGNGGGGAVSMDKIDMFSFYICGYLTYRPTSTE